VVWVRNRQGIGNVKGQKKRKKKASGHEPKVPVSVLQDFLEGQRVWGKISGDLKGKMNFTEYRKAGLGLEL